VRVPAELFTKGNLYYFMVQTSQSGSDYAGGQLVAKAPPSWDIATSTGLFRLSDQCGNGVKDPGEDCDPGPGGATATCDADCTVAKCGDGVVNAAAGEACDEGGDGPNCDADCTLPVCGDGHWNRIVEDCDDGNTKDGDGCSGNCGFVETC